MMLYNDGMNEITFKGRPARLGKPFRCFRDPSRKYFGFIDKITVSYTDGLQPTGECLTVAQFNKIHLAECKAQKV